MKKFAAILLAGLMLCFAACSAGSPRESGGSATDASISISDISIALGDNLVIEPVFTPERDAVSYSEYDESIISIKNGMIRTISAGDTTVRADCDNSDAFCVFRVTVSELEGTSEIESFNEAGTFDADEPLSLWTLSGETASEHIVEADLEGGNKSKALKLWASDGGAIDLVLSRTISNLPAGEYTFMLTARAGQFDEISVSINDDDYLWSEGSIGSSGNPSYFLYTLPTTGDISFSLSVSAAAGNAGWGYIDDISIQSGNAVPENLVSSSTINYSFEDGLDGWLLDAPESGLLSANSSTAASSGVYALNYWGEMSKNDSFTLKQNINGVAEGTYRLSVSLIVGCDQGLEKLEDAVLYIKNYDGTGGELTVDVSRVSGWNEGVFTEYSIEDIDISSSELEVGLRMTMGADTVWIHLDDLILARA